MRIFFGTINHTQGMYELSGGRYSYAAPRSEYNHLYVPVSDNGFEDCIIFNPKEGRFGSFIYTSNMNTSNIDKKPGMAIYDYLDTELNDNYAVDYLFSDAPNWVQKRKFVNFDNINDLMDENWLEIREYKLKNVDIYIVIFIIDCLLQGKKVIVQSKDIQKAKEYLYMSLKLLPKKISNEFSYCSNATRKDIFNIIDISCTSNFEDESLKEYNVFNIDGQLSLKLKDIKSNFAIFLSNVYERGNRNFYSIDGFLDKYSKKYNIDLYSVNNDFTDAYSLVLLDISCDNFDGSKTNEALQFIYNKYDEVNKGCYSSKLDLFFNKLKLISFNIFFDDINLKLFSSLNSEQRDFYFNFICDCEELNDVLLKASKNIIKIIISDNSSTLDYIKIISKSELIKNSFKELYTDIIISGEWFNIKFNEIKNDILSLDYDFSKLQYDLKKFYSIIKKYGNDSVLSLEYYDLLYKNCNFNKELQEFVSGIYSIKLIKDSNIYNLLFKLLNRDFYKILDLISNNNNNELLDEKYKELVIKVFESKNLDDRIRIYDKYQNIMWILYKEKEDREQVKSTRLKELWWEMVEGKNSFFNYLFDAYKSRNIK